MVNGLDEIATLTSGKNLQRSIMAGHDLSQFYEGWLEKGGFSKLNLRKVRRRPGGGGGRTNIEGLRRGLKGGLRRETSQGA